MTQNHSPITYDWLRIIQDLFNNSRLIALHICFLLDSKHKGDFFFYCIIYEAYITWVTKGSSSLSTARVRISRLFGSHLKLMLAVLMVLMVAGKD